MKALSQYFQVCKQYVESHLEHIQYGSSKGSAPEVILNVPVWQCLHIFIILRQVLQVTFFLFLVEFVIIAPHGVLTCSMPFDTVMRV